MASNYPESASSTDSNDSMAEGFPIFPEGNRYSTGYEV